MVRKEREDAYSEISIALEIEGMGHAANFVTDLLINLRRDDNETAQEKEKDNEMGESHKDSSSGE